MQVTLRGHKFLVSDEHKSFWQSAEEGKWEPYTFEILEKYVPFHDNYLDIGAWIGPTVLFASRFCKNCFAVEPDPVAFKELRENAKPGTWLCPVALSDHDGELALGSESLGNSMTRVSADRPGFDLLAVPCHTLEKFVEIHKITGSMFIKMDVEGSEEFILRDTSFFEKHKPTLYFSLHPQWFRDSTTAMETVNRVGALYRYQVHPAIGDTNTVLFTDHGPR